MNIYYICTNNKQLTTIHPSSVAVSDVEHGIVRLCAFVTYSSDITLNDIQFFKNIYFYVNTIYKVNKYGSHVDSAPVVRLVPMH